jgi:hypothetical protein
MAGPESIEPDAQMRALAATCWQMFVALTREGFTESQALEIIGHAIKANTAGGQ